MFFYNVIKLATIAQWTFRLIYRPCFVKRATNLSRDKINFVSKNYHLKYRF